MKKSQATHRRVRHHRHHPVRHQSYLSRIHPRLSRRRRGKEGGDPCGDMPPSYSAQSRGALVAWAREARRHLPRPPGSPVPLLSSLTGGPSWACAHRRCCSGPPTTGRCRPSPSGRGPASKSAHARLSSRRRAAPRARGRPGRWLAKASRSDFLQNPQSFIRTPTTPQIQSEAFIIEERLRFEQRHQSLLLDVFARHELVLLQDITETRRWR